jgi:hypothetical protein
MNSKTYKWRRRQMRVFARSFRATRSPFDLQSALWFREASLGRDADKIAVPSILPLRVVPA